MAQRPESVNSARKAMRQALQYLNNKGMAMADGETVFFTPCADRPVPFTEVSQSVEKAAELCGKGTDHECPVLKLCEQVGYTVGLQADNMVYGGLTWRKGKPLVKRKKTGV